MSTCPTCGVVWSGPAPVPVSPPGMPITDAVFMIETIAPHFTLLSDWEKDFILGQATMAMSGKVSELTEAQATKLRAIYAKVRLVNVFPGGVLAKYKADYRNRQDAGETT